MALTLLKLAGGIILALVLAFLAYAVYYHEAPMAAAPQGQLRSATVTIGGAVVDARVADTDAAREQGLSGTGSLPEGQGMLFVFNSPGHYAFWMKDMNYSLDILWANASGTITTIYPNLSPATYPQAFSPATADTLYVLEVPAGWVAEHNIKVGDVMQISRT